MIADDLNLTLLKTHHQNPHGTWKPGRMVIETSPGNYQIWIHSDRNLSLDEKRYWLKIMKSDPGADPKHRWGRCPGFFNKKDKYQTPSGHYPLAKMIWVDWVNVAHIPPMLKINPMKISTSGCSISNITFQNNSIRRIHYERGNESITDFAYALALARRGFSKQQIIERILAERTDWKNHTGDLRKMRNLDRTVSKAVNIIASSTISY